VSISQLVALGRRHFIIVAVVFIVALGIAYEFKHTNEGYAETATVSLASNSPDNSSYDGSLINTCEFLVTWISGPEGQSQLQQIGVDGGFSVSLVNASNADDPQYYHPYLAVSMTDQNAASERQEFAQGIALLQRELASLQASDKMPPQMQVNAQVLDDSGPVTQQGSRVRVYGSLLFLALVAAYMLTKLLDGRGARLSRRAQGMART
jgi:hypothetical protein